MSRVLKAYAVETKTILICEFVDERDQPHLLRATLGFVDASRINLRQSVRQFFVMLWNESAGWKFLCLLFFCMRNEESLAIFDTFQNVIVLIVSVVFTKSPRSKSDPAPLCTRSTSS